MKVQNIKRTDQGLHAVREMDVHGAREGRELIFKRTLTGLSEEHHKARIQDMKNGIDEQAMRLADKIDVREFERYRQLIREFLDEIVSNGYTFSRENAYASRGRHRFIATVRTIDEKLDEIGKEVLKEQADKIEILGKIDDIRGLLLDLML